MPAQGYQAPPGASPPYDTGTAYAAPAGGAGPPGYAPPAAPGYPAAPQAPGYPAAPQPPYGGPVGSPYTAPVADRGWPAAAPVGADTLAAPGVAGSAPAAVAAPPVPPVPPGWPVAEPAYQPAWGAEPGHQPAPGWPPPAGYQPGYQPGYQHGPQGGWPPHAAYGQYPQPWRRPEPEPTHAPAEREAGWTTFAAIGVGALFHGMLWLLTSSSTIENEARIRYAIVTAVAVYTIVTYLVVSRIQSDGHPLRWLGSWGYLPSAALGLAIGGGLAKLMLSISEASGVEGGDQGIAVLVSEGSFAYIGVAFLIVCVAAPIVEELLFRGLLLSSLMHRGARFAVWISAFAFAAWHLEPSLLRYYSVAGALLGYLYVKQGLTASIAAHFAFNGTLLMAAVAWAVAPGPVVTQGDLTLRAPDGWHAVEGAPIGYLHGPSRGEVVVIEVGGQYDDLSAPELVARVQLGTMPELVGFEVRKDTARTIDLPAGEAVRVTAKHEGKDGDVVLLPTPDGLYVIVLASGGSTRVRDDFDAMLQSIQVS